jgi:signal transduction histidine kinase
VTPRELRAAIAADDEKRLRAAVKACGEALGGDDVGVDRTGLGGVLLELVDHPIGEVRQALAEICDTLPEAIFDQVVERLSKDSDRYVQNAAAGGAARHAAKKVARGKGEQREQGLKGILDEIEEKHSKAARRRAEAAVRRGVEHFVRRLEHELRKTDETTTRAQAALRAEIEKPDASRALMLRHASALDEQHEFRQAIVRRAREYATHVKGVFAEASISAIVDDARRQLADRLGERVSQLSVVVDIDPELVAEVDRHALLQALQNVLQNAAEAYPPERAQWPLRIAARTMRAKSLVELRVTDEAGGIPDDEKKGLFVPFGSTKPGGTGVGMLITRAMIEAVHGGELGIESTDGVGTTVTMVIPMRQRGGR